MACKFIIILATASFCKAAVVSIAPAIPVVPAKIEEYDTAPQYSFAYDVQDALTGDSKAQYETRNGDIVQGSYSFIEADGTRRIVDYTADPINGFNAIVSRESALKAIAAAPIAPIAPADVALIRPVAPIGSANGPVPTVPMSGPDSDVEVLDARSGPIRESPARRFNERFGDQTAQLNRRYSGAMERNENSGAVPIRAVASRFPATPDRSAPQAITSDNAALSKHSVSAPVQSTNLAYPPYIAYTTAYSSPRAFSAPASGLTYTSLKY